MINLRHEQLPYEFSEFFTNEYAKVFVDIPSKIIICEAISPYIPIAEFMETFTRCKLVVEKENITKFIFDKRAMTSFHQPSMEWYFLTWKKELMDLGLYIHRKVLPNEKWFRDCVDACKTQMLNNTEHSFLTRMDLKYFESVKECIEQ